MLVNPCAIVSWISLASRSPLGQHARLVLTGASSARVRSSWAISSARSALWLMIRVIQVPNATENAIAGRRDPERDGRRPPTGARATSATGG